MAPSLTADPDFLTTTYVVIDFETTTPRGSRPEPIDVAAVFLRPASGRLEEVDRFSALIAPPPHAPLTPSDTAQTGITSTMLAGRPRAGEVLGQLDSRLTGPPYLLVAHNAPTEAGVLSDHREHCPHLAGIGFLDTVRLARAVLPDLADGFGGADNTSQRCLGSQGTRQYCGVEPAVAMGYGPAPGQRVEWTRTCHVDGHSRCLWRSHRSGPADRGGLTGMDAS